MGTASREAAICARGAPGEAPTLTELSVARQHAIKCVKLTGASSARSPRALHLRMTQCRSSLLARIGTVDCHLIGTGV
jgi:hypothetical protein